jgi:hypothetical protein
MFRRFMTLALTILFCSSAFAATINGATWLRSTLTVNGVGFTGAVTATLNGKALTIVSSTSTQIVANVPFVLDTGNYRLVVKAGKASTFAYVSTPAPVLMTGGCYGINWGVGQYTTIWLVGDGGDQSCKYGAHYPPYMGVIARSAGVLEHMTVSGQFAGTATVYVNYVPTILSCTVLAYPLASDAVGCEDATTRIQINAGDAIDLGMTPSVGQINNVEASLQLQEQ